MHLNPHPASGTLAHSVDATRGTVEWLSAEVGLDRRTGDWVLAGPLLPPRADGLAPDPAYWAAMIGR